MLCYSATSMLGWPGRGSKAGSFIGYSSSGQPLYSFNTDAFARTSHSIATVMKNGLRQILEESDSRKIFYFLCINLVSFSFIVHCIYVILDDVKSVETIWHVHVPGTCMYMYMYSTCWDIAIPIQCVAWLLSDVHFRGIGVWGMD